MATPPIEVERVPIAAVDPRPSEPEDPQVLLAPHHDEPPWDRMISNDTSMLEQEPIITDAEFLAWWKKTRSASS